MRRREMRKCNLLAATIAVVTLPAIANAGVLSGICDGDESKLSDATHVALYCGTTNNPGLATTINGDSLFGFNDWVYSDKWDDDGQEGGNPKIIEFASDPGIGNNLGLWNIIVNGPVSDAIIALKAGSGNVLFKLDPTLDGNDGDLDDNPLTNVTGDIFEGEWSTEHELSNIAIYTRGGITPTFLPPSAVPLPAAVWAMIAALGALGGLRLRRS